MRHCGRPGPIVARSITILLAFLGFSITIRLAFLGFFRLGGIIKTRHIDWFDHTLADMGIFLYLSDVASSLHDLHYTMYSSVHLITFSSKRRTLSINHFGNPAQSVS